MRVIFMGTPEFSVPTLQKLIDSSDFDVVAVYTRQPAKAKRGQKIVNSPIHQLALQHNIEVVTPISLKNEQELQKFQSFNADLAVIVAYGLILPENIIESTKFGCINLHPSLLPKYRGATPIQSTLLNGDKIGGVSIIKMDKGVDSGPILLQEIYDINPEDDFLTLAPKFADIGADMILRVGKSLYSGEDVAIEQDHKNATMSRKITKADAEIDFSCTVDEVLSKIKAFTGFLTANFTLKDQKIKIFSARRILKVELKSDFVRVGDIEVNHELVIKCRDGYLQPLMLQKPGGKPLIIQDFLLGFKTSSYML